jgi:phosphohistidine phosphatase
MPKHLILFRHAEATTKLPNQSDKERDLTSHGITQSVQVGAQIAEKAIPIDVIFCSTANRARQTALLAADAMKFDQQKIKYEDEIYDASTRTLFSFINKIEDSFQSVMCVGHNPTFTYLAEYLTQEAIGDLVTAGIVIIKFDVNSWAELSQGNGELLHYLQPRTYDQN